MEYVVDNLSSIATNLEKHTMYGVVHTSINTHMDCTFLSPVNASISAFQIDHNILQYSVLSLNNNISITVLGM